MSAFKDAVKKDIEGVFLNIDEFADRHKLNGQDVICLVDEDKTEAAKVSVRNPYEGIFVNAITIYVKSADLERQPVEGELLRLDKALYRVASVSSEMGMLTIVAEANKQ